MSSKRVAEPTILLKEFREEMSEEAKKGRKNNRSEFL
jgi:hypothetical protein